MPKQTWTLAFERVESDIVIDPSLRMRAFLRWPKRLFGLTLKTGVRFKLRDGVKSTKGRPNSQPVVGNPLGGSRRILIYSKKQSLIITYKHFLRTYKGRLIVARQFTAGDMGKRRLLRPLYVLRKCL